MCLFTRRYWIRIYAMAWPFLGSKCSFQSAKRILSGNIISVSHYHCEYAKTISSQTLRYPESGKHWLPFYWNPFGILALNTYQIKQILFVNLSTHLYRYPGSLWYSGNGPSIPSRGFPSFDGILMHLQWIPPLFLMLHHHYPTNILVNLWYLEKKHSRF